MKKIIATALPVFALRSKRAPELSGTLGAGELFVKWLKKTGQSGWQILPIHETHLEPGSQTRHAPSPYKGYGVGIDPRYIPPADLKWMPNAARLKRFIKTHRAWLLNYALFCALRDFFGTDDWSRWPGKIRDCQESDKRRWRRALSAEIMNKIIEQARAHRAYARLRERARADGIRLIGDVAFYIPRQSPLVWANQKLFALDKKGFPLQVSGISGGPRAHFGRQVWGHPLYDWQNKSKQKALLELWRLRLGYNAELFDCLRLDHAKGFFFYGIIGKTARADKLGRGPGAKFLRALVKFCRSKAVFVFAEDSGDNTAELRAELKRLRAPGIRIIRFGYNEKRTAVNENYLLVKQFPRRTVAYTTTHDTETLTGYLKLLKTSEKRLICLAMSLRFSLDIKTLARAILKEILKSPARMVTIPLQDWLLDDERVNVPGTEKASGDANWQYVMPKTIERLPARLV